MGFIFPAIPFLIVSLATLQRIATLSVFLQVVLVLDDEALQAELNEVRPDNVEVVALPKSGGVVQNAAPRVRNRATS